MKTTKDFKIGDLVSFTVQYDRKLSNRVEVKFDNDLNFTEAKFVAKLHVSPALGQVVGVRSVIMSDYKYHSGKATEDDFEQAYVTGKRESVLLVTTSIYKEPFIVRIQDVNIISN